MEEKSNKSLSGGHAWHMSPLDMKESKVMEKMIRKSKGANRRLTCSKGGHSHLIIRPNRWGGGGEKKEKRERRGRSSNFSLRSTEITKN